MLLCESYGKKRETIGSGVVLSRAGGFNPAPNHQPDSGPGSLRLFFRRDIENESAKDQPAPCLFTASGDCRCATRRDLDALSDFDSGGCERGESADGCEGVAGKRSSDAAGTKAFAQALLCAGVAGPTTRQSKAASGTRLSRQDSPTCVCKNADIPALPPASVKAERGSSDSRDGFAARCEISYQSEREEPCAPFAPASPPA